MLAAIDLSGDMISYACLAGNGIETEVLRNTIGFRTTDLFKIDGAIGGMMQVAKSMVECTVGESITEAICVLPQYVSYQEREKLKHAAADCGITVKKLITGSLASAYGLFQNEDLGKKTILLSTVRSDYAEFLLYEVDGEVLTVFGSSMVQYAKDPLNLDPERLKKKIVSEIQAMYSELNIKFGEKDEEIYFTFDEKTEFLKRLFTEAFGTCFEKEPVHFENDSAKGAFARLMKIESYREELIRKCFTVDCCIEGISIGSGVGGALTEICRRNTPLPVKKEVSLPVSSDNVLCFYSGNYMNREHDEPIGSCRIPSAYFGQSVHVKITVTEDAVVEYSVLDSKRQVIYPRQVLK